MAQAAVKDTTGYVNYVYNISARGTTEVASQLMGLSGMATNILGQLAFQTSSYLSTTEGALLSMGVIATAGFGKATKQAMEFDQALSTIGAISGKTRGEVEDLGDQAMAMSSKFGVAVNEMTTGLESLARAGVSQNNMTAILEEAMGLSKLEDLSLNTAINDLISTTNLLDTQGLDLSSPEYAEAVRYQNQKITATSEAAPINAQDIIHTLEHIGGYASSTNLDQDDLYAVIAQLGSKGTKSEMAGTSLRAFISAGQKDTAQRALERIGLSVKDLWKNDETILSISDMKDVLDEAMESRGYTQQEKLEFYSDFAGYKQANQIMKIDTSSVRDFKEKIDHSWNMGQKINQVIGTAETHVQGLLQAGTNLLTKVGEPFLPIISTIAWTLRTGIDIINSIPGSNLIIAGGLVLASVKAVSTIFNKIAPQIIAAKGNIGSISGLFTGIRSDLEESYNIIKNINNTDWMNEKARKNDLNRISNEDKIGYWSAREGRKVSGSEIYSLEKIYGFKEKDQRYKTWKISGWTTEKKGETYPSYMGQVPYDREKWDEYTEERNKRQEQKNKPKSANESSNNRKDNKKTDYNSIIQVMKEGFVNQIYNTNTIKDRVADIYNILSGSIIDKTVIDDLKTNIFSVYVTNMENRSSSGNNSGGGGSRPNNSDPDFILPGPRIRFADTSSSSNTQTKSETKATEVEISSSDSQPKFRTKLFTNGKLDPVKVDKYIEDFDFKFGFDETTIEGREAQKIAINYAKDILRDNFQHRRNKLTGRSPEELERTIKKETEDYVQPLFTNKGGSIIASQPHITTYSSDDEIEGVLPNRNGRQYYSAPNISYDESLKKKSETLKPLGLDYNRLSRTDRIDTMKYLGALATFADIDIDGITGKNYKSNTAKKIVEVFTEKPKDEKESKKFKEKQEKLKETVSKLDNLFYNPIAHHYIKDLNSSQRSEFMTSVGLESSGNEYVDMINYLNKYDTEEYQKDDTRFKHLDSLFEIGNIIQGDRDRFTINSRTEYSAYRRDLTKGPNVKNEVNAATEKAIKMQGVTGYNGIGSHIRKIVYAKVEQAVQEDILEIQSELEAMLGRDVSVSEVINMMPSLVSPSRFKFDHNTYDDIGRESPDFSTTYETIHKGKKALHNKKVGGSEKYRNRTFDKNNEFGQLERFKLVYADGRPKVYYEEEDEELANFTYKDFMALIKPPELVKGSETIGPKKIGGNNTGTKDVGVAEVRNLPYYFEGTPIKKMGARLPTHGRDMDNTAVMYIAPPTYLGENIDEDFQMEQFGRVLAPGTEVLRGFIRNDKGRYHEAYNWALTQKRNRETMRTNQEIAFGGIAKQYGIDRQDIMQMPISESQQKRIDEFYKQQSFVNIDQYVKEHGEEGLKQLRGQMSLHKFDHDYKTGKLVDNGGMFEIQVTPEEYKRRVNEGLVYLGEGDQGILKKTKNKDGKELYTINDFESLHYSYNDVKRMVLLQDIVRAKTLENSNIVKKEKENMGDWINSDVSDILMTMLGLDEEEFNSLQNTDLESMGINISDIKSEIDNNYEEFSQYDTIKELSPDDIAEELINAPTKQVSLLMHAIYLFNQDLYNQVRKSLKNKYEEEIEEIESFENAKKDASDKIRIFNNALDVVDDLFPGLKESLSNKEKVEYMGHIAQSEDPLSELAIIAKRKNLDISNSTFVNNDSIENLSSDFNSFDGSGYNEMEDRQRDFVFAMEDYDYNTVSNIAMAKDERTAEFLEELRDYAETYDTRDIVSPIGQKADTRAKRIKEILQVGINKENMEDYQAINEYFGYKSNILSGGLTGDALNIIGGLKNIPKYYNPNLIYKETTPGGDEEPSVIDVDEEWNKTDTYARELYKTGDYERILGLYDAMREGGQSLSPQMRNWAMLVTRLNGLNDPKKHFDKDSAIIPPLEEMTSEIFSTYSKEQEEYVQYWRDRLSNTTASDSATDNKIDVAKIYKQMMADPSLTFEDVGIKVGSPEYHAIRDLSLKEPYEGYYIEQAKDEKTGRKKKEESETEDASSRNEYVTDKNGNTYLVKNVDSKYEFVDSGPVTEESMEYATNLLLDFIKKDLSEHYGTPIKDISLDHDANTINIVFDNTSQNKNIDPNTTNWNDMTDNLVDAQQRAKNKEDKTSSQIRDSVSMPNGISGADYNIISQYTNWQAQSIYEQYGQNIKEKMNNFVDSKVNTIYDHFKDQDNTNIGSQVHNFGSRIESVTDVLQGFSNIIQDASEVFPPLTIAVVTLEGVISSIKTIQSGAYGIESFLNIGKYISSGDGIELFNQTITSDSNIGKLLMSASGALGIALEKLLLFVNQFLGPIALITVGLFALKGALDWSYQSHEKYLKSLQEEQKEKRSKVKGLQTTNEDAQERARNNRAPRQQAALDRNAQLAQTRLDNANMSRSYGAIEISRQKNDTLWGDYGIAAGLGKLQGNYESTAAEYDGTSGQIRRIKEATLANPFSSDAMNQVASYYDANQLAFGVMDEYKDELGKLYDAETSAMLKYHSDDVRGSPEFNKALDDFVEATGITRDHAKQYLDYMQTEHEVDKATQAMQAQADQIAASTELKVQAIAFGGNPADVLGLNGIEAQQDAMIKAQGDMIKMELSGQLWWKAVWSTITTPIKLVLSPLFIIVDLLNAIWSLITGNVGGAFESGSRAASRLNVFGEAATYWGAWADVEGTDFNAIGQGATDSYNRANYGNVEQPASGGYHPTHFLDANANQDRRESVGGGYSGGQPPRGGYFDHRESQTHYINANRGSYHFFDRGGHQGSQPTAQLNPLSSIGTMLSTIISILTTGLLVGGGIYGLTKFLKSDLSLGEIGKGIFSTLKGGGANLLDSIFAEGTMMGALKDKLSPITNMLLDSFGTRKDQIKGFFGLETGGIGDNFNKLQNEAQAYLRDPETADAASWQAKILGKATVAKEDFLSKNAWGNYLGEKIMPDDFSKKKRKGMNAGDREYLAKRYGLKIEGATANQKNKNIRKQLDEQGKWDEAMLDLHNNRYMGKTVVDHAHGVVNDYVNPWKEYIGEKVNNKKEEGKGIIKNYLSDLKTQAELYNENPESVGMAKYDRSKASLPVKILGEAFGIKDKIFGNDPKTDFNPLIKDPKKFFSDPRNIESMGRDIYSNYKDRYQKAKDDPAAQEEYDWYKEGGAMRFMDLSRENKIRAIGDKLSGIKTNVFGMEEGESVQEMLKNPERTVEVLKTGFDNIKENGFLESFGLDEDFGIGDAVKDKVSGFFEEIKEGAEEGIDDSEGKGGNGGLIDRAKKKLAGFFGFGEEKEEEKESKQEPTAADKDPNSLKNIIKNKDKDPQAYAKYVEMNKPDMNGPPLLGNEERYGALEGEEKDDFANMSYKERIQYMKDKATVEKARASINAPFIQESTPGAMEDDASILDFDDDGYDDFYSTSSEFYNDGYDDFYPTFSDSHNDGYDDFYPTFSDSHNDGYDDFYSIFNDSHDDGYDDFYSIFSESNNIKSQNTISQALSDSFIIDKEGKRMPTFAKPFVDRMTNKEPVSQNTISQTLSDSFIIDKEGKRMPTFAKPFVDRMTNKEGLEDTSSILNIAEEGGDLLSSDNLSKGGKGLSKVGKTLSGKGGKLGKVGNLMSKVGGGMFKTGSKGLGGVAKGGIGKVGKGLLGKVGGKIGGKLAAKGLAQVGSKVLGGALIASGIGAPLGLLLESPIGGMLMEGAMNLGGQALGAIGGAVGGVGKAIGGFLGFGPKTHYQKAGQGGGGLGALGAMMPGVGALGAVAGGIGGMLGGLFGGRQSAGAGGLGAMKMIQPLGMMTGLLGSIFKNNRDHKNHSQNIGDRVGKILKALGEKNKPQSSNGGNITIQNININTADDPEAIKAMFLELLIELQEQVNPRLVSRTVGEPPANSTTDTTATETPTDEQTTEEDKLQPQGNITVNN